jgi:Protein of unknown function (DUF1153)
MKEARRRYILTTKEFFAWQDSIAPFGLSGLRITRDAETRMAAYSGEQSCGRLDQAFGNSSVRPHAR